MTARCEVKDSNSRLDSVIEFFVESSQYRAQYMATLSPPYCIDPNVIIRELQVILCMVISINRIGSDCRTHGVISKLSRYGSGALHNRPRMSLHEEHGSRQWGRSEAILEAVAVSAERDFV